MKGNTKTTYLLNLSTRTVHDAESKDGRCRLALIQEGNKKVFDTLAEAMSFLPPGKKIAKPCAFCLANECSPKEK